MAFELPDLPYAYDALEPHIDAETMRIHHDLHHGAYVTNANAALEGTQLADASIESVLTNLELRDLITEVGRGSGPGQPKLYGTTMRFLLVMGLESLDHLPAPTTTGGK